MATPKARRATPASPSSRPLPPSARVGEAFARLAKRAALPTLVRGALPTSVLKRLLKDAFPRRAAAEIPPEVWPSLAVGIALGSPEFGMALAQELHDRLAWDREPDDLDRWWALVRERPLEALWMAALSDSRSVKKEFPHVVEHCLENYRASPECKPPSWEFLDGILEIQAQTTRQLRETEKEAEDAERRYESERERLEELRDELKRLRRELSELRAEKAQAERRAAALDTQNRAGAASQEFRRIEELERRLRKAEKEREHLARENERLKPAAPTSTSEPPFVEEADDGEPEGAAPAAREPSLSEDPNPRRRVLRQILRKLFKKGKIGASHTHEDNVYRGVADHEKGIAKEAIDLLYREGLLMPKPTATDPHVSLRPDRTREVRSIIAGEIANPRLQRFVEGPRA